VRETQAVDFVIVGGGVAGLRAAIGLAPRGRVLVLTKAAPAESNTGYAQGGIAAAMGDDDNPALHASDTIRAGDGLCDEAAVEVLVGDGPRFVRELIEWGAASLPRRQAWPWPTVPTGYSTTYRQPWRRYQGQTP